VAVATAMSIGIEICAEIKLAARGGVCVYVYTREGKERPKRGCGYPGRKNYFRKSVTFGVKKSLLRR
jgi:hypothetical protein